MVQWLERLIGCYYVLIMSKVSAVEKAETKGSLLVKLVDYGRAFLELGKFRLSLSVAFSALAAYFITIDIISWQQVIMLGMGGLFLAMSANALNQYLERDIDALMDRTANRPLVTGFLSPPMAVAYVIFSVSIALILLGMLCWCAALLGVIAWVTYILGYTFLKRRTARAVELGSLSGALPAAIGVLVASPESWILASLFFVVQFVWQYPHTWIILKLYESQYDRIGTKIRAPKRLNSALLITSVVPPLVMIPVGLIVGLNWLVMLSVSAVFIFWIAKVWFAFNKKGDERSLRNLLIVNLLMLPLHYSLFILLKFIGI